MPTRIRPSLGDFAHVESGPVNLARAPDPHSRSEDHALIEELIRAKQGEPEEQSLFADGGVGLPLG